MRHATAGANDRPERSADEDPPLTPDGMTKARAAARGLAVLEIEASAFLTSPLLRAAQTAEIVSQVLVIPGDQIRRTDALKPESPPGQLMEELMRLDDEEVLCVGHSPQLDDVISHLLGCRVRVTALKKTAVACLELDSSSPPRGVLLWLYPQKVLRHLGK